MNTRFASALLLSLTLASTSVMADGRGYDRDNDRGHSEGHSQRESRSQSDNRDRNNHYNQRDSRSNRQDDRRYESRRDDRHDRRDDRAYYDGARHFQKGDHIDSRYRDRVYYVNDWDHHHLRRPPRGHVWVQVGGDYVLMAIATGIIASIILNH